MGTNYETVKSYLFELGYNIIQEDTKNQLVVIDDENRGLKNLVIDCEEPIVLLEQFIFELKSDDAAVLKKLLRWNRELVHGAFCIDDGGTKVLFRDTLQLTNLDLNELEASIDALSLAMAEYSEQILQIVHS